MSSTEQAEEPFSEEKFQELVHLVPLNRRNRAREDVDDHSLVVKILLALKESGNRGVSPLGHSGYGKKLDGGSYRQFNTAMRRRGYPYRIKRCGKGNVRLSGMGSLPAPVNRRYFSGLPGYGG